MDQENNIETLKKELPYGKYIFEDGTQILFNRNYDLLVGSVEVDLTGLEEKIKTARRKWFYTDKNPPWIDKNTFELCKLIAKVFDAR